MLKQMFSLSFDMIWIYLLFLVLVLFQSDCTRAFISKPATWQTYSYVNNRVVSIIVWSVLDEPGRVAAVDRTREIQEVAMERKYNKENNYNSKVYSFQRSSSTTSTTLWESKLRNATIYKDWNTASTLLNTLKSTKLSSGHDVVYIITETCRRSNSVAGIIPLLSAMTNLEKGFDYTTENDIMPFLVDCVKTKSNSISMGYRVVSWLQNKDVIFTAKTYSTLLKGFGQQQNEVLVDRMILECVKYSIRPDIILFNAALDAYIRCDNPQKAIDLFDTVMSTKTEVVNSKSNLLSNKEKNVMLEISAAFVNNNNNLRPNVRTYNTILKALRGYETFDKCLDAVRSMKNRDIKPDSITLNTLVDAAVMSGNFNSAENLIKYPMATPGVEAYTALIAGYSGQGNVKEAFRVLNFMISKKVLPNSFTFTALMKTCVIKGDWERARELLYIGNIYLNSTTTKSTTTYPPNSFKIGPLSSTPYLSPRDLAVLHGSYVIGLCSVAVSADDKEESELYVKEAQLELLNMEENQLRPDTATMNAFIRALCSMRPSRVTDALLVLRAMKIENIQPDAFTYSILFTSLGKEGYVDEALQLFRNTEMFMDSTAINSLLRSFVSSPNPLQAVQLYQEIITGNSNSSISEYGSLSPEKSTPPLERPNSLNDYDRSKGRSSRRFANKPLRFLTTFSRYNRTVNVPEDTNANTTAIIVDTTIQSVPPRPFTALSVLGKVVKSLGEKLNTQINNNKNDNSQVYFEIKGVHGNYVSSSSDNDNSDSVSDFSNGSSSNIQKSNEKDIEVTDSQPLVYDDLSGRFYERTQPSPRSGSGSSTKNSIGISAVNSMEKVPDTKSVKSVKTATYSADDIFDSSSDIPQDRYAPQDSLDRLRINYYKDQQAKNQLKVESIERKKKELIIPTDKDLTKMSSDELLRKLFLSMRFDYDIEVDEILVSALNSLFTNANNYQSYTQPMGIDDKLKLDRLKEGEKGSVSSSNFNLYNYKPVTPSAVSLGWGKKTVLSKKTAELVFADLVISGWHPSESLPVLYSCGYPQKQVSELLKEEANNVAIKKIRSNSASILIFKNHNWNDMESGWSTI